MCSNCDLHPIDPDSVATDDPDAHVEALVEQVAILVQELDAGLPVDFDTLDTDIVKLLIIWRSCEKTVNTRRANRIKAMIDGMTQISKV